MSIYDKKPPIRGLFLFILPFGIFHLITVYRFLQGDSRMGGERFQRFDDVYPGVFVEIVLGVPGQCQFKAKVVQVILVHQERNISPDSVSAGKVCIGTVKGDLHDIGKNLVKMMMEGKGLEVVDLGTDVAPETYVDTAVSQGCQIICCSALLTTTMPVMEEVVKAAEKAGIRDKVKIMIGGAPVTEDFCRQIGADRYTADAASAADAAVELCRAAG